VSVIIFSLENDYHADVVVNSLTTQNVEVIRIDPTNDKRLPCSVQIRSGSNNSAALLFNNRKSIDFNNVTGIFCRFALESLVPAQQDDPLKFFSDSESLAAFLAPFRLIESYKWINDPWLESRSDCRILQSNIAHSIGLNVPDFIVSNCYQDLVDFYNTHNEVIIKSISDAPLAQIDGEFVSPEKIGNRSFKAPYTTPFKPINGCNDVDDTPTLLQVAVNKKADIRSTVIDNQVFSALMPYTDGDPTDFRCNTNIKVEPHRLPEDIENKLVQLNRMLRVRFSSCDLVLDHHERYHFLEANLQGNWLWTEFGADLQISIAIAKALIGTNILEE